MSKPKRIQRKRTKGYRLPRRATCVTGSAWRNPFETAKEFRKWMHDLERGNAVYGRADEVQHMVRIHKDIEQLKGFDLACWCSLDKECHADVLLEYANRQP